MTIARTALTAAFATLALVFSGCAEPDARESAPTSSGERFVTAETSEDGTADQDLDEAFASRFVEECEGVWSCSGAGDLVLHREGPSCILGDVVVELPLRAPYREMPSSETERGSWRAHVRAIEVEAAAGVLLRCDRKN